MINVKTIMRFEIKRALNDKKYTRTNIAHGI